MAPAYLQHIRASMARYSERLPEILRHVGTSSLVGIPMDADFDAPELRPYLDTYFRGRGIGARERVRLAKLAWDLACDSFAGRQTLYERLHHGDPIRNTALVYQDYDKSRAVALVERLLSEP